MKFKRGDKVVCIDTDSQFGFEADAGLRKNPWNLEINKIYDVFSTSEGLIGHPFAIGVRGSGWIHEDHFVLESEYYKSYKSLSIQDLNELRTLL